MTTTSSTNGNGTPPTDPEALRLEIARTRAGLGDTVEALAAKADVKARAQDGVAAAKVRVREGVEQVAANAVSAGRELRTHPGESARLALDRLRRSVREHPAPWAVASGALLLIGLLGYRKGQR